MLHVKSSYTGKYNELKCRWCKETTETQQHILQDCTEFKDRTANVPYETYFSNTKEALKITAKTLRKALKKNRTE